jgi:hypothetical protein
MRPTRRCSRSYAPVDSNALTMRVEDIRLRSSLAQAQAALDLLLAPPF